MYVMAEDQDGVRVLRLDRPPVNAQDVETLDGLSVALASAAGDEGVTAIVLTGTGTIMSAGADLVKVLDATDDEIDGGIDALTRCFSTLFRVLKPVVAAVNGHALAGGAVLTCGCDHRVMGESGRIGAVEHAAGVPFPAWALELVRHGVNNEHFEEIVLFGRSYEPRDALERGLIDEVVPDAELMDVALQRARKLARIPATTYALTKRSVRAAAVERAEALRKWDDEVKASWRSPEVKAAILRQIERLRS